jgi:hypothetical protein
MALVRLIRHFGPLRGSGFNGASKDSPYQSHCRGDFPPVRIVRAFFRPSGGRGIFRHSDWRGDVEALFLCDLPRTRRHSLLAATSEPVGVVLATTRRILDGFGPSTGDFGPLRGSGFNGASKDAPTNPIVVAIFRRFGLSERFSGVRVVVVFSGVRVVAAIFRRCFYAICREPAAIHCWPQRRNR